MTEMLEPQPGESVYDPTCGTGGSVFALVCHTPAPKQKKEWRNVKFVRAGAPIS